VCWSASRRKPDPDGSIAGVRWENANQGTPEAPKVRCRLMVQALAGKDMRDDLLADTPPLAAVHYVLSAAASCGMTRGKERNATLIYSKRDNSMCVLQRSKRLAVSCTCG